MGGVPIALSESETGKIQKPQRPRGDNLLEPAVRSSLNVSIHKNLTGDSTFWGDEERFRISGLPGVGGVGHGLSS